MSDKRFEMLVERNRKNNLKYIKERVAELGYSDKKLVNGIYEILCDKMIVEITAITKTQNIYTVTYQTLHMDYGVLTKTIIVLGN